MCADLIAHVADFLSFADRAAIVRANRQLHDHRLSILSVEDLVGYCARFDKNCSVYLISQRLMCVWLHVVRFSIRSVAMVMSSSGCVEVVVRTVRKESYDGGPVAEVINLSPDDIRKEPLVLLRALLGKRE